MDPEESLSVLSLNVPSLQCQPWPSRSTIDIIFSKIKFWNNWVLHPNTRYIGAQRCEACEGWRRERGGACPWLVRLPSCKEASGLGLTLAKNLLPLHIWLNIQICQMGAVSPVDYELSVLNLPFDFKSTFLSLKWMSISIMLLDRYQQNKDMFTHLIDNSLFIKTLKTFCNNNETIVCFYWQQIYYWMP